MTPQSAQRPATPQDSRSRARTLAAVVCGVQAVLLAAFAIYWLWQLVRGAEDPVRVGTEFGLIALGAGGLGVLARLWLRGSTWAPTPTVVWHLLLIPVTVSMIQSGQWLIGVALILAIVVAIGAVIASRSEPEP